MSKVVQKIDKLLQEGIYDPSIFKAIFLAGGCGSGKSFVASKTTGGLGYKMLNSDAIFEKYLKDAKMDFDMRKYTPEQLVQKEIVRDKAKALSLKITDNYIEGRLGLIIDGTGKHYGTIADKKAQLEKLGYDTFMIFVNTSLKVALKRNSMRDRKVPEDQAEESWHQAQENIGKFNKLFGNNFVVIDNSKDETDNEIMTDVWKQVKAFSTKSPNNKIAKQWIANYKY